MKISSLILASGLLVGPLFAEEKETSSSISSLLSSLRENVRDLDVSQSVTDLPKQLAEMKANYVSQGQTVLELKAEVETLRKELAALRQEVNAMKGIAPAAPGQSVTLEESPKSN